MKNLKRALSFLLASLLVFGAVAFSPVSRVGTQSVGIPVMGSDSEAVSLSSAAKPELTPSEEFLSVVSDGDYSDVSPLIILPGISHSELYLADDNEPDGIANNASGGNIINGTVPVDFLGEIKEYIPKVVWELVKTLVTQRSSDSLAETTREVASKLFGNLACDDNGVPINKDYKLIRYNRQRAEFLQWHEDHPDTPAKDFNSALSDEEAALPTSYADMYPSDFERMHKLVTTSYADAGIDGFEERVGCDKMFFFTFSLYSDPSENAAELEKFIQDVKKVTGFDKVSLLNVSLGGTVFTAWADLYGAKNNYKDLDRVVNAVAVLNGTYFAADFLRAMAFNKTERKDRYELNPYFNLSDEYLYSDFMKDLAGDMSDSDAKNAVTAALLNAAIRILPRDAVLDLLSSAYGAISEAIFLRTPEIWATVPSEVYSEISDTLLKDLPNIKAKTDVFYKAQCDLKDNLLAMTKAGVAVNSICGYGFRFGDIDSQFFKILASSLVKNGDGVINIESTSMGATAATPGAKLPYNSTTLDTKEHSYISPDGAVDASTCALPNNTWFFKNMLHEDANSNSPTTNLIMALALTDEPFNVLDYPEYYQQFGESANNKDYRRWTIADAEKLINDETVELTPEFTAELQKTIKRAQVELQSIQCDAQEVAAIHESFATLLRDYFPNEARYQPEDEKLIKTAEILTAVEEAVYEFVGGQGFSDFSRAVLRGDSRIQPFAFLKCIYDNLVSEAESIK